MVQCRQEPRAPSQIRMCGATSLCRCGAWDSLSSIAILEKNREERMLKRTPPVLRIQALTVLSPQLMRTEPFPSALMGDRLTVGLAKMTYPLGIPGRPL